MSRCKECRKKTYRDFGHATSAAVRNAGTFGAAIRAYECPHGNGWHLTTKPKREVS